MKREPRDLPMLSVRLQKRLNEGLLIIAAMTSLFLLISFLTYHPDTAINSAGKMGDSFAELFFNFFGYFAYLFPFLILYWGWSTYKDTLQREKPNYLYLLVQLLGFMIIFMAGCALNTILYGTSLTLPKGCGGLLGLALAQGLVALFNSTGSILILCGLFLTGITLATGLSWLELTQKAGRGTVDLFFYFYESIKQLKTPLLKEKTDPPIFERLPVIVPPISRTKKQPEIDMPVATISENPVQQRSVQIFKPVILKPPLPSVSSTFSSLPMTAEDLPAIDLLDAPDILLHKEGYSTEELESLSRNVELRLEDFGISVQVVAVHPGPVVTRFEMQLAAGIKVSRITSLVKDLARSLSVISVRIVEVIPGKSVVGLEVPNKQREIVRLSEIINSAPYKQAPSPLSLALGKDIAGHPVIVDLGKMPHLLVAGTTGSGKSVGLNAMLLSILYKATPAQVRLIMIDPKMLELAIYEGIPHLLAPVVTNMKEAANALRWCVAEMERRYKVMAKLGVRNLAGFNQKIEEASNKLPHPFFTGQPGESEFLEPLPYLVVLVDEFADMMMVVGKKVEELIARIAQKARAAGIHLILATQRPSVDVITGLIKANIPTRMAFQVSSKIDSRTILDQQGAEQLLGYGDMLYLAPGAGVPVRVHGAFVADHEVHKVVKALKEAGAPDYVLSITENNLESLDGKTDYEGTEEGEQDVLYDQAVQIIIETRRASISNIQRRLKIGYNRAARLMEDMEKAGLVSAMESNGNREVLLPARD